MRRRLAAIPREELMVVVACFLAMLGVAAFSMGIMLAYGVFPA